MSQSDVKPIPDWIKALPAYAEQAGLLASLYPGTRRATVELAGVEWHADSHESDPSLCHHLTEDRILYLRYRSGAYHWRTTLIVKTSVLYADVVGTADTAEEAAIAAMATEFRNTVIDGTTWYASAWGAGVEWKALRDDQVMSISEHSSGGFEWHAPFDGIEIFKAAGMSFDTNYLSGFAESFEDAVRAFNDAPAALRAACRNYLALGTNKNTRQDAA